ncbi:mediator of RNA polymerase II transcription subunit 11 [Lepeophtheirus salmonis]|uniref:mediator of RNA polymerase II transcription subunit 11 n=1 Tax=Lepeophtheirus salmonis TaxID=72036 RepID=UPI001AE952F8|nr:mediator of RNA polymerase II transcription subunit 11-like [Lepeophtheirus salmonis]
MSTSSSTGIGASPGERIELLDEIEKDVIGILVNSGGALQEISKDRPSQKQVDTLCQATISSIKSVESKLAEQIKYLTQVSTGHPHEGSSYPAQKILQTAWHRLEHARSRISDLDRTRNQTSHLVQAQKQTFGSHQVAAKQQRLQLSVPQPTPQQVQPQGSPAQTPQQQQTPSS